LFKNFFSRRQEKRQAYGLYTSLVKQARQAEFYTDLDVEDSIEGRFDMILLHLFLVDDRLAVEGDICVSFRRSLQEAMVSDMDRSFRELGVGDMSVGKEMKKVGSAWLGRQSAYQSACAEGAEAGLLSDAILKNLYNDTKTDKADVMAKYMRAVQNLLASVPVTSVKEGKFAFPVVS